MTLPDAADAAEAAPVPAVDAPPTTGVARVDAALATLAGLEDEPVAERVAVLERVHQELRRALDHPGDDEDAGASGGTDPA